MLWGEVRPVPSGILTHRVSSRQLVASPLTSGSAARLRKGADVVGTIDLAIADRAVTRIAMNADPDEAVAQRVSRSTRDEPRRPERPLGKCIEVVGLEARH